MRAGQRLDAELKASLEIRQRQGLYRQRQTLYSPQQPQVRLLDQTCLAFCSNDYLGLAADPRVVSALKEGAARYGVGGGASHLVSGHSYAHHALEEALAEFTQRPRALLFSSGYMANLGVLTALLSAQDRVYQDRLNHASLLDGGRLSAARFRRYPHQDVQRLAQWLQQDETSGRRLVVTDGVFSMDGDVARLDDLARICHAENAYLMVDDAHGFGVLGQQGGGCAEAFNLNVDELPILIGTLGKAFGTAGAFVAGSETLIETLIQFARPYIYTTSLPPAVAHATLTSLQLLREEGHRREHLRQLIQQFRTGCQALGLNLMPSSTPIQPLVVGSAQAALAMSDALRARGIWVTAIRPPTVPEGTARLRVTLTASHTSEQVDRLLNALAQASRVDNDQS
ncbi:8-amino-7-oxononanoate synthase [Nitrincola tapanii]|uniref:8-amino-7-oxononanoate synthase n=1 Tax=Nitrincola tapanii TaxID=1708751 RepID=A0A5A9W196_9GAMM|nr:8-amino-7-oxononanoate synthase [Nitrincola tapanii]